jgi:rhamnose utilization protein RhaD (predicted bifunctional aldolase and dehydrogenase)
VQARADRKELAVQIAPLPARRRSAPSRWIASFSDAPDVLQFVNSSHAKDLRSSARAAPITLSAPKFGRSLCRGSGRRSGRAEEADRVRSPNTASSIAPTTTTFATPDSPALRDTSPTVVLIPGLGMFSFGKNKTEARITGEFYTNAIHVMEGASLLAEGEVRSEGTLPQCGEGMDPESFKVFTNYVALPASEAFRIEYWAHGRSQDPPSTAGKELSRRIALVVGGGSGIGREVALLACCARSPCCGCRSR